VLCVFSQSIGLPVFPTGAIVVVGTEKENMISLDPGLPLGWGGHYRPLLHKVLTTSMFECVAYYRQMSSWLYGKLQELSCLICLTHALVA
jgi:hypothetical protein